MHALTHPRQRGHQAPRPLVPDDPRGYSSSSPRSACSAAAIVHAALDQPRRPPRVPHRRSPALSGLMILMALLWLTNPSPVNTLKGRIPQWERGRVDRIGRRRASPRSPRSNKSTRAARRSRGRGRQPQGGGRPQPDRHQERADRRDPLGRRRQVRGLRGRDRLPRHQQPGDRRRRDRKPVQGRHRRRVPLDPRQPPQAALRGGHHLQGRPEPRRRRGALRRQAADAEV